MEKLSSHEKISSYAIAYEVEIREGENVKGQKMTARTHHNWILVDNGKRYPQLEFLRVKVVRPFTAVKKILEQ